MTQVMPAPDEFQMARLQTAYAHGAPPHALCLIGPGHLPLEPLASHLASALLCQAESGRPCGTCRACGRVAGGAHANLLRLGLAPKERTVKIEALRRLLDALALHPQESGPRVVIISDVHAMTVQAQNALLKSLEEPEASDFFILTAQVEQAVLPTIRSRCELHRMHENSAWDVLQTVSPPGEDASEALLMLAEQTVFAVKSAADIPAASTLLRSQKDQQDALLDLVEARVLQCLQAKSADTPWSNASPLALRRVLDTLLQARRYLASNVSWQAVADRLLFAITKEIYQCPLS